MGHVQAGRVEREVRLGSVHRLGWPVCTYWFSSSHKSIFDGTYRGIIPSVVRRLEEREHVCWHSEIRPAEGQQHITHRHHISKAAIDFLKRVSNKHWPIAAAPQLGISTTRPE